MNWLRQRKYLALLIALVLLVGVYPMLHPLLWMRVLFDLFLTALLLAALKVVFTARWLRGVSLVLGAVTIVGAWTGYVLPDVPRVPLGLVFHLCGAAFLALTVTTVLRTIHQEETISTDSVHGAFCGYLLVGLCFAHLYCAIELVAPGSFSGDLMGSELLSESRRHFLFVYFSLATLTTVGFGDLIPNSDPVRGVAMIEAVTGQFYLAVLIAELIGKRQGGRSEGAKDEPA